MKILLSVFLIASVLGIFFFLAYKSSLLFNFPEKKNTGKKIGVYLKEKLLLAKNKLWSNKFLCRFLQLILSFLRRVVLRLEQLITKWLYFLKRKNKEK